MSEFTVACPVCGEVVGLLYGGERVPEAIHVCPGHDALDHDMEERSRRAEDPDGFVMRTLLSRRYRKETT